MLPNMSVFSKITKTNNFLKKDQIYSGAYSQSLALAVYANFVDSHRAICFLWKFCDLGHRIVPCVTASLDDCK